MKEYLIDLHIHTPASNCFQRVSAPDAEIAKKIVQACLTKKLDIIAITDHHSVEFIDKIREAAKGTPLTILPGVELSAQIDDVDEVFLLAIFPKDEKVERLREFLLSLGITRPNWGGGGFVVPKGVGFIIGQIKKFSGIVISSRQDKTEYRRKVLRKVVQDYKIRNFDLVYPENKKIITSFLPRGNEANYFHFSDAHSPSEIGKRKSRLKTLDRRLFKR